MYPSNQIEVLRLVTRQNLNEYRKQTSCEHLKKAERSLYAAVKYLVKEKKKAFVIQTPGGFIRYCSPLIQYSSGISSNPKDYDSITIDCNRHVSKILSRSLLAGLRKVTDYLTLGIDIKDRVDPDNGPHVELVATYDVKAAKFISWTGKSSPVSEQKNNLIYCNDWGSHFQKWRNKNVLILGCHDLNIFSPRSRKLVKQGTYKYKLSKYFNNKSKRYNPDIVLHHPHNTDCTKTWSTGWVGVMRAYPKLQTYSSGINYYNGDGKRNKLEDVLKATAKGRVNYFIVKKSPK